MHGVLLVEGTHGQGTTNSTFLLEERALLRLHRPRPSLRRGRLLLPSQPPSFSTPFQTTPSIAGTNLRWCQALQNWRSVERVELGGWARGAPPPHGGPLHLAPRSPAGLPRVKWHLFFFFFFIMPSFPCRREKISTLAGIELATSRQKTPGNQVSYGPRRNTGSSTPAIHTLHWSIVPTPIPHPTPNCLARG